MIKIIIDGEEYTEEQYKKDYVRMMDSLRQDSFGEKNCMGVDCGNCPLLKKTCSYQGRENSYYRCLETVKIVRNWAKDHPSKVSYKQNIITNRDKIKEAFGKCALDILLKTNYIYNYDSGKFELDDEINEWLNEEYKDPKSEK